MQRSAYGTLLDAVRTLTWPAQRRTAGTRTGTHRSALRGRAPELTEYRRYRQGDDPRDLDWKLLARSDRAFVRLSEDRSVLETWVLLDASASMAFPLPGNDKWQCACAMAVALTSIAQRAGDPVGVKAASMQLAPTTRRDAVHAVEELLAAVHPRGESPMAPLLAGVPHTSRVVIVSDLLGDAESLLAMGRAHLAAGGEVTVVHLLSPEEHTLRGDDGLVRDPEAPTVLRPVDDAARDTYQQNLSSWLSACAASWSSAGASYTFMRTDDDVASVVRRVVRSDR